MYKPLSFQLLVQNQNGYQAYWGWETNFPNFRLINCHPTRMKGKTLCWTDCNNPFPIKQTSLLNWFNLPIILKCLRSHFIQKKFHVIFVNWIVLSKLSFLIFHTQNESKTVITLLRGDQKASGFKCCINYFSATIKNTYATISFLLTHWKLYQKKRNFVVLALTYFQLM